jgi:hypothetical protein
MRRHLPPKKRRGKPAWSGIGVINAIVINIAGTADPDQGANIVGMIINKLATSSGGTL